MHSTLVAIIVLVLLEMTWAQEGVLQAKALAYARLLLKGAARAAAAKASVTSKIVQDQLQAGTCIAVKGRVTMRLRSPSTYSFCRS